jgi:hypothetical protein
MQIKAPFFGLLLLLSIASLNVHAKNVFQAGDKIATDSTELVEFTGKYNFKQNEMVQHVTIKIEKNVLIVTDQDSNVYNLEKEKDKPDAFKITELQADVVFVRDSNKKIITMKVSVQGQELIAEKEQEVKK